MITVEQLRSTGRLTTFSDDELEMLRVFLVSRGNMRELEKHLALAGHATVLTATGLIVWCVGAAFRRESRDAFSRLVRTSGLRR